MFMSSGGIGSFIVGIQLVFVYFRGFNWVDRRFGYIRFGRVVCCWCFRICRCWLVRRLYLLLSWLVIVVTSQYRITAVRRRRHHWTLSRVNKRVVRLVSHQSDLIGQIRARCRIAQRIRIAICGIEHSRRGFISLDRFQFQFENRLRQVVLQLGSFYVFRVELRTLYENFDRLFVN